MYQRFGLTLVITHDCNLACGYCYAGRKFSRKMADEIADAALRRAVASLHPGGTLELGFFGGEPLLEAALIERVLGLAEELAHRNGLDLSAGLTTNGAIRDETAWRVMRHPRMNLALSFDGLPEIHDRHRTFRGGGRSSRVVLETIRLLREAGRTPRIVCVVRPDTASMLAEGLEFLRTLGIEMVDLNLDLWTNWSSADEDRLEEALIRCARVWREGLPRFGVNWFNSLLARAAGLARDGVAGCGFGRGEIAVAPSGRLYPCERLVGEDAPDHPARLPGHALLGADFLPAPECDAAGPAAPCAQAGLWCQCSRWIRTGATNREDRLLRRVEAVCMREVQAALVAG